MNKKLDCRAYARNDEPADDLKRNEYKKGARIFSSLLLSISIVLVLNRLYKPI